MRSAKSRGDGSGWNCVAYRSAPTRYACTGHVSLPASSTAPGGTSADPSLCAVKAWNTGPAGPKSGSAAASVVQRISAAVASSGVSMPTSPPRRRVTTPIPKHVKNAVVAPSIARSAIRSRSASTRRCASDLRTSVTLNGEPPITNPA